MELYLKEKSSDIWTKHVARKLTEISTKFKIGHSFLYTLYLHFYQLIPKWLNLFQDLISLSYVNFKKFSAIENFSYGLCVHQLFGQESKKFKRICKVIFKVEYLDKFLILKVKSG